MAKHKKFLKSEKAKIKLKGAKLPKGLNITKTEFKVKKIIIQEQQLKDLRNEEGALQKQNVKDIVSKFHHHNATYRIEALRHIKQTLVHFPDDIKNSMNSVIKELAKLCLDEENDVRKESFKTLIMLLSITSSEQILPFYDILSTYLLCAMTHIHIRIQEDSLLLLDIFMEYLPTLISTYSDKIFSSFLDMISKLHVESEPIRTLKLNLDSKMTSVKWRINVLNRLLSMLNIMVVENEQKSLNNYLEYHNKEDSLENVFNSTENSNSIGTVTKTSALNKINYFQCNKFMNFSIIRKELNQNCELPTLFRKSSTDNKLIVTTIIGNNNEEAHLKRYANILMPLLLETWQEVKSFKSITNYDGDEYVITNDTAFTLKIVLKIIDKLYALITSWDKEFNTNINRKWFSEMFLSDYCVQFLRQFPYCQELNMNSDVSKNRKSKSLNQQNKEQMKESGGEKCSEQNFSIVYLFYCMYGNVQRIENYKSSTILLIRFLKSRLNIVHFKQFEYSNTEASQFLIKSLRIIFLNSNFIFDNHINNNNNSKIRHLHMNIRKQHLESIKDLLKSIIFLYQNNQFLKEIRTKILLLLCDILLDSTLIKCYGNDLFSKWIETLPNLLCQSFISNHVLLTLLHLAKQNNKDFLKNLEMKQYEIFGNLNKIQLLGNDEYQTIEIKKQIINLFYWTENWSCVNVKELNVFNLDNELVSFIEQIYRLRLIKL